MFLKPYPSFESPTGDGRNIVLLDYLYWNEYRCIPNSPTDGGTIPRVLWSIQAPFGPEWLSFVLHDCLYQGNVEISMGNNSWRRVQLPFNECNELLLKALREEGINELKANLIYKAVQLWGQEAFSEDLSKPIMK